MLKFSLILPVYNVEKYITKCLLSCISQDLSIDEYEIIVIIDGSPDNSKHIVQSYAKDYTNIVIVEQDNKGLSAARNVGLMKSRGEYVWFIDTDDFIEKNILKNLYTVLSSNELECIWLQWRHIDENNSVLPEYTPYMNNYNLEVMSGLSFMREVLNTHLFAWSFIYKRSFLINNELLFKNMTFEDADFALRAIPLLSKIQLYPNLCYNYLLRAGSITHSIDEKKLKDILYNVVTGKQSYDKVKDEDLKLAVFYKKNYSCLIIMALKEIAKLGDEELWYIFDKVRIGNNIKVVIPHGNKISKVICCVFNIMGARFTYFLCKKINKILHK